MKVESPTDPRLAPFLRLRTVMEVPQLDAEEKAEKQIIHRLELRDRVRKL